MREQDDEPGMFGFDGDRDPLDLPDAEGPEPARRRWLPIGLGLGAAAVAVEAEHHPAVVLPAHAASR